MKYETKPDFHPCNCCKEVLPFTEEFFSPSPNCKYDMNYECRKCEQHRKAVSRKKRPVNVIYHSAKRRAKKANLPFDLDEAYLESIRTTHCPLLGVELVYGGMHNKKGNATLPNSASLDKIIPELGYIKGNVRFLSFQANAMKRNATPDQLITFAKNLLAEHNIRNINE